MKRVIFTNVIVLLLSLMAMAQDKKVAVFDPAGSVDLSVKEIVREEISSIIVNTAGYTVLERQLINKVLEENKFQMGGLVDDSQISEIGKRMGANYVFVTSISPMEDNLYHLSFKMIDVTTARIEKQKTARTAKSGTTELLNIVQKTVVEMFSEIQNPSVNTTKMGANNSVAHGLLIVDGRKIYQNGRQLSQNEVRSLLATSNTDASPLYNEGILKNTYGSYWLYPGIGAAAIGGILILSTMDPDSNTFGAAVIIGAAGIVATTIGTIMKSNSKKLIGRSVETYNRGGSFSSAELKFGVTGNGVGLVLNF